jgi:PAS domain S-box-containing protein
MDMPAAPDPALPSVVPSAADPAWQLLFTRHPLPMWVYDAQTLRFLAVNDVAVRSYGWSEAEFMAMGLMDLRTPDEQARLRQHMALPAAERPTGLDWRHRKRNGQFIDVETISRPMRFAGRAAFVVLATDITQRKRHEARTANHERVMSLVAAGAPLPDVLEAIVRGVEALHAGMLCSVLVLDGSGQRLRMGAAPSLPAFFNEAADGMPVSAGSACCGEAAFLGQRVIAEDVHTDPRWLPYRDLAARAGVASCWSEPILSRAGSVLGTFGVYHRHPHRPGADEIATISDMARMAAIAIERKQADEALRQTQKLESLGTLAGGVAHDFNNVLGAILGNVALARQSGAPEQALEQIQRSALRARLLVQQILAFSRRQAPRAVRQPLGPLIGDALELLRATLPAGVQLQTRLDAALPDVEADGTQVQQLLMNLCTNAWHAMSGAVGHVEIGARAEAADGGAPDPSWAHIWVRDPGCGMDEATRARIFEPFFTTKPVGVGTGLGLAVVHGIVAEHHGRITVDTAPGQGSTFHVWLPRARADAPAPLPVRLPDALPAGGAGRHVLFVDDDEVMLITGEGLLRQQGWRVTPAASGVAALAQLRAAPDSFDLVVTDQNMPDCSGLDLARLLLAVRPGLPLVICSGYIDQELHARAQAAGVRAIVHKEYVVEELASTLVRVLASGA